MHFSKLIAVVVALGVSNVLGHGIMVEPEPFNLDTEPLYQTWPLSESLPFPCQGRTQHPEKVTTVTAGKVQTVKFWISAVHGGGSCQFSVGYGETPPPNVEDWRTIYSIIGGCPADAKGNIETERLDPHQREDGPHCGNDFDKECVREFQIPIPAKMKNGPATFAWTWFNKIGDREMYMTCAPIIVEGGINDDSYVSTLPPIFLANFPGQCRTGLSGSVIGFPDPGEFGKVYQQPTEDSQGTCPAAVIPDFDRGDTVSSAPPGASSATKAATSTGAKPGFPTVVTRLPPGASSGAKSAVTSTATGMASSAVSSGAKTGVSSAVTSAVKSSASSAVASVAATSVAPPPYSAPPASKVQTSMPAKDTTRSYPTSAAATSKAATSKAAAPSSAPPIKDCRPEWAVGMIPCSPPGALVCLDNNQFGICNHGWTVPHPLAAGQKCVDGQITHS